jgi:hypothetical protein
MGRTDGRGLSIPAEPNEGSRVRARRVLAVAFVVFGGMLATLSASAALEFRNDEQGPTTRSARAI